MVSGVNQVLVDVFAMQGPSASSSFFGPDFRQLPCEANICRKRQEAILFWEFSQIRFLTSWCDVRMRQIDVFLPQDSGF
jgi:hypothetical protein